MRFRHSTRTFRGMAGGAFTPESQTHVIPLHILMTGFRHSSGNSSFTDLVVEPTRIESEQLSAHTPFSWGGASGDVIE
jgi:hypothetical protein